MNYSSRRRIHEPQENGVTNSPDTFRISKNLSRKEMIYITILRLIWCFICITFRTDEFWNLRETSWFMIGALEAYRRESLIFVSDIKANVKTLERHWTNYGDLFWEFFICSSGRWGVTLKSLIKRWVRNKVFIFYHCFKMWSATIKFTRQSEHFTLLFIC